MSYAIRQRRMIEKAGAGVGPRRFKVVEQIVIIPGVSTHPSTYSAVRDEVVIAEDLERHEAIGLLKMRD